MPKMYSLRARDNSDDVVFDDSEIIERYIVLLLGVKNEPIPSLTHLEKEIFIFSRTSEVIGNIIKFEEHNFGPYSQEVRDIVFDPVTERGIFEVDGSKIYLTEKGRKYYEKLIKKHGNNPRFKQLLIILKMIRELYDKLSTDELLFLIYITYPEYRKYSIKYRELLQKKEELARKLLAKGLITLKRYEEILYMEV